MNQVKCLIHESYTCRDPRCAGPVGHTPGPWTYDGGKPGNRHEGAIRACWFDIPDHAIARTTWTLGRDYEAVAHANGRLMALSPELLAFVRKWRDEVLGGDHPEALDGWARELVQEAGELIRRVEGC